MSMLLVAIFSASAAGLRLTSAVGSTTKASASVVLRAGTVSAQVGGPQLPPGWQAYQDEQGQVYYCNEALGQCQWEVPSLPAGGQQYGEQSPYGTQGQYQQPTDSRDYVLSAQDEEAVAYIAQQLQEPQLRIPRAVVEFLGSATAYDLLDQTAQVQNAGGMIVPETGKPRTNGGVYLQLLRSATHLPRDAQEAALQRIKDTGKKVKAWEKAAAPGWQ